MSQQRKSSRKKQTRLNFDPLPYSSPHRSPAHVRIDESSSPIRRRRVGIDSSHDAAPSSPAVFTTMPSAKQQSVQVSVQSPSKKPSQLPTPAASSQAGLRDSEDSIAITHSKSKYGVNPENPIREGTTNTTKSEQTASDTSEDDYMPVFNVPKVRAPPTRLSSSSASEPVTPGSRRAPRSRRISASPQTPTQSENSSYKRPSARSFLLGGSSGAAPISHSQRRKSSAASKRPQPTYHRSENSDPEDTSSDEQENIRIPSKRLLRSSRRSKQEVRSAKADRSHDPSIEGPEDSIEAKRFGFDPFITPNASNAIMIPDDNEGSDLSDILPTPGRRRRTTIPNGNLPPDAGEASDKETDLEDELEDLRGTDTEIRSTRTRGKPNTSERSRRLDKLEELKRRRAGVEEVEEENCSKEADSESDNLKEDGVVSSLEDRNLDAYDSDFLDDKDDTVGVDLGRQGVPLEFTYHANKKPIEHFKAEIEWMVHNKLNPAFDRNDEIYLLAHRKLDDEVQGYAGSKFVSSVWREDFNKELKSRPDFFRVEVPTMHEHKCDACNRSGHPPKHRVTFSGKPYNRQTLETISHDDEDEDSEESQDSNTTNDEQSFFLGRFCCANAEIAHALHHWRYALNQTVLEWLAAHGHLSPDKIVQREHSRQKKRAKAANKVVDGMEEEGVMKTLYRQFKENLDAARSAKPERWSSG